MLKINKINWWIHYENLNRWTKFHCCCLKNEKVGQKVTPEVMVEVIKVGHSSWSAKMYKLAKFGCFSFKSKKAGQNVKLKVSKVNHSELNIKV